jgi:hypothetical protein
VDFVGNAIACPPRHITENFLARYRIRVLGIECPAKGSHFERKPNPEEQKNSQRDECDGQQDEQERHHLWILFFGPPLRNQNSTLVHRS